jgi:release factor glutamine methyltransferase
MNLNIILRKSSDELKKAGIPTASLDVRVLLEDVLKKDTSIVFTHPEMPLTNTQYARFRSLIRRRKKGEPVAYLIGHKEFYGYDFFVNKNVLIPRPETELLVEQAIEFIKLKVHKAKSEIKIIDIGTGSGCIIISLILELYKLSTFSFILKCCASDISSKALYVARKNAKFHQVNKDIKFYYSDLFANKLMPKKYDVIIANLPYVPTNNSKLIANNSKLRSGIYFEPQKAIFAENNGTKIIKQFLDQAKDRINKDGLILIEVDPRNAKVLQKYTKDIFPKSKVELLKDLAKLDRVIRILN